MQGSDLRGDMLMRRPVSGERGARPKTTGTRFADKGSQRQAKPGHNLHKIYGNIDDLVGLEEAQINQLNQQRTENQATGEENYRLQGRARGQVQHDPRRIEGLESIYMMKIGQNTQQSASKMDGRRTSEGMRPYRPTMIQYLADDPAEASAHTRMEGTHFQPG